MEIHRFMETKEILGEFRKCTEVLEKFMESKECVGSFAECLKTKIF